MHGEMFFLQLLFIGLTSADLLQNPDFESPPDNGHAIQLGQDGKINQTFIATGDNMNYLLTFTLVPGGQNCSANADVVVSAPDSRGVFSLKQHYGKESWESYGHYLGRWDRGEPINLVIESLTTESDANSTCWPMIDMLFLKTDPALAQADGNLLLNGGFEVGPDFLSNSTEGILLESAPSPVQSALLQWTVIGTVKYIDSKHFFVPEGNAAIEIVSGVSTGIQIDVMLTEGSSYYVNFTAGHAGDGCDRKLMVRVQAGPVVRNITLESSGTRSAVKYSVPFKAGSGPNPISFLSGSTNQTKDGVFCGPIIDEVVLRASHGLKPQLKLEILIYVLVLAVVL
ncbi:uncharacterized protein LOC116110455 isoform X2 [Pistacia vera]|uniref:uncharacterized protein LOC116110455 isoform X2 n=1 Tax=Pistacia vera TaxID=55513 RepID=UPI0012638A65|nr:uncharacterized protein LOC116110455 isoform X2 [Pistacia vera]